MTDAHFPRVVGLSSVLFFMATDLLSFYIYFEFALIPLVWLILRRGEYPERLAAALWFVLYTVFGSLPLLLTLLYAASERCRFYIWAQGARVALALPLILAFMVKLPVYGVHLWLPRAHVQAPVAGRIFLAAVMLKFGGYGIFWVLPLMAGGVGFIFIAAALFGSILAMINCLTGDDVKLIIAYSSVGHMGLVLASLATNNSLGVKASLLVMVGHGFTSSLLFFRANELYLARQTRRLTLSKGMLSTASTLVLFFGAGLLLNIRLPPSINLMGELAARLSLAAYLPSAFVFLFLLVLLGGAFNL